MRTLIVGGGPAGGMAALHLARAGHAPTLFERSPSGHSPVCGGFVGGDAIALIERRVGSLDDLNAQPITQVRFMTERPLTVTLPFRAAGLSRQRFDRMLRAKAEEAGAVIHYGAHVREIDAAERTIRVGDEVIAGDRIILASGKQDVRGVRREVGMRKMSVGWRAGAKVDAKTADALAGTIELYLFREGYAGVLLDGTGQANMALSVSEARSRAAGGREHLIAALSEENPRFGDRLALGTDWEGWEATARVPYGWRAAGAAPNLFRAGDQAAVIASLCGDGIAIALSSGLAAAQAVINGEEPADFQTRFGRTAGPAVRAGEALRWIAERERPRRVALAAGRAIPSLVRKAAALTRAGSEATGQH